MGAVRSRTAVTCVRLIAIGVASALAVVACGKTGAKAPVAGVYHLAGAGERGTTNLELRSDGTFTVRRESCESIGDLECGAWKTEPTGGTHVVTREGLYWPTPDEYPSAIVRTVTLRPRGDELIVVGESDWAGTFTQRWAPGRTCEECRDGRERASHETAQPCADPLPACTPRRPP
jgi:hypothetical protein